MAGTIFGLGLSQQIDSDGKPLAGAKLYISQNDAPVDIFKTTGLSQSLKHPWPLPTNANGRFPAFWLPDGTYRVRLTTAAGVGIFDESGILALGPSSGEGGGGDTVDPTAVRKTGDFDPQPYSGVREGYVRANARTIGSAISGAAERAHADCEPLFLNTWGRYSDAQCPVVGGRGLTAAADWAANKQITLPDGRGRSFVGIDGMGHTLAGRLSANTVTTGAPDTPMSFGGLERIILATSELPAHPHGASHSHPLAGGIEVTNNGNLGGASPILRPTGSGGTPYGGNTSVNNLTTDQTGGGAAHNNMPPFFTGTWYIKL